ncbi:MAG: FAD-binding oxidoreductase, partial [Roseibium sp.]
MKDALGPVSVLTPLEPDSRYLTDWSRDHHGIALAIVRPRSIAEVQKTVAYCFNNAIPVIPQGGNTGLVSGSVNAKTACVVINLELLNQVREIDEKNFSMNVDAGCLLRTVKEAAEARQLIFPLSLGSEGSCQIGGNVAA